LNAPKIKDFDLPFNSDMTMRDLLPEIAKHFKDKINLYTDQFSFVISSEDQSKLKLMSTIVNLDSNIASIGVLKFGMQKKVYQDMNRLPAGNIKRNPTRSERGRGGRESMQNDRRALKSVNSSSKVNYTAATAAAYQEWEVIKKNKMGRKQERMLGIDGTKMYNHKRGDKKGKSDVATLERDISTIIKIENIGSDGKSFKCSFADGGIFDIEWTCERTEACAEIISKLKFLMPRR